MDAFRHAYWMARLTQSIGRKKALKLGEAHELGNYQDYLSGKVEEVHLPDSMSSVMDRWNNRLGAGIGEGCAHFQKNSWSSDSSTRSATAVPENCARTDRVNFSTAPDNV